MSEIKLHEGEWYANFKNEVFIRCLHKLFPRPLSELIASTDGSSSANLEWLNYNAAILKTVDSLANEFTKRTEASWVIEGRKVTMNVCMQYRNSPELDAIAVYFFNKREELID